MKKNKFKLKRELLLGMILLFLPFTGHSSKTFLLNFITINAFQNEQNTQQQEVSGGQSNQNENDTIGISKTESLDDVVVIGYGTVRKSSTTSAVSSLKAKQIDSQNNTNVGNAIQGKVAGVSVESTGGPGAGTKIQIRGAGSLNNNNPLILVDDIQVPNMNNINPSDVESIEVLKDAAASAVYGSRAANGVIIITTKNGKKGDLSVTFNAFAGVSSITNQLKLLNQEEWAKVNTAAYAAAGKAPNPLALNPEVGGAGTNWQNEIYRSAPSQNYSLGFSGGAERYKYNLSFGYNDQEGIVKNTNYQRLNLRAKSDFNKGIFKIGETILLSKENSKLLPGVPGQAGNTVTAAVLSIPSFAIYNDKAVGGYGGPSGEVMDIFNPVAALNLFHPATLTYTALVNTYVEANFFAGLKYKLNLGANVQDYRYNNYEQRYQVGTFWDVPDNILSKETKLSTFTQVENTLNYTKTFGNHYINALAGYTIYNDSREKQYGTVRGMPDGVEQLNGSKMPGVTSSLEQYNLVSYLGRAIYSYNDKYVLTGTLRRDGSSRFSKDNKWGNFGSISGAWSIFKEDFFSNLNSPISNLKLRASYGILGNQEIGDYQYLALITAGISYPQGDPGNLWSGNIQTDNPAFNLKWESTATSNIGLDLDLWNGKIQYTLDIFNKQTTDLLLRVPIPLSVGSATDPYTNAGNISNKGFEMSLSYNEKIGDFNFSITGNLTHITNNVESLSTGSQVIEGERGAMHGDAVTYTQVGYPIYSFFLVETAGLFRSQSEIDSYVNKNGEKIQPYAQVGDIKYVDYNGDGQITSKDKQYKGSSFPDFEYGLRFQADWKGIDFTAVLQGTQGNKIYNGNNTYLESVKLNTNYSSTTLNSYTFNPNGDFPRLDIEDKNNNGATYSDRYLEDGSYLRMRTIQLGYTIPNRISKKIAIDKFRVYFSGDNLFTFTNYSGYNPDVSYNSFGGRGIDYRSYPLTKTIILGLSLNL